jgi:hypothetical protein
MLGNTSMTDASDNPIGSVAGKWTCAGSSDSVTAAMDGTNRLLANANWVRASAGTAHSWIVLKSPTTGFGPAPVYILLDYSTGSNDTVAVAYSKLGFTGGSTTAAPTATDEFAIGLNSTPQSWQFNDGSAANHHFHAILSTIGDILVLSSKDASGYFWSAFYFTLLAETKTTDVYPWVGFTSYLNALPGIFQVSDLGSSSEWAARHFNGASVDEGTGFYPVGGSGSYQFNAFLPPGGDNQDGSRADAYILFGSWHTAPTTDGTIRGRIADVKWYSFCANADVGKVSPTSGTPQIVFLGNACVPANVVPML